jgi:hypothetical protein
MLFAASGGVSEFDGEVWRKITVPSTTVRSLAEDENGRIWAGLNGGLGYLEIDPQGQYRYVSLLDQVPPAHRQITAVWQVLPTKHGTYFRAYEALFRWDGKKMHTWTTNGRFEALSEVRGRLYTAQSGIGLQEIIGDELRPLPGGDAYRGSAKLFLHPYGDKEILVSQRGGKFTIYDGERARPFKTELDAYLEKNESYVLAALGPGVYSVTTLRGGAAVFDRDGRLLHLFDENLPGKNVLTAARDREGALWLGLGEGMVRAEIQSPIRLFGKVGPNGTATHQGEVYAAFASGGGGDQEAGAGSRDRIDGLTSGPHQGESSLGICLIRRSTAGLDLPGSATGSRRIRGSADPWRGRTRGSEQRDPAVAR